MEWLASLLVRFGVPRLASGLFGAKAYLDDLRRKLPPEIAPAETSQPFQTKHITAYFRELDAVDESIRQIRAAHGLGETPLLVLTERSGPASPVNPEDQEIGRGWDELMG